MNLIDQIIEALENSQRCWEEYKSTQVTHARAVSEMNEAQTRWEVANREVDRLRKLETLRAESKQDQSLKNCAREALEWLDQNAPGRAREALLKIINHKEP